ncbi:MAG: ABC transporter permease [Cyclobacteriaceae bacterium]|nr:ABC transporter permease [Cyclobacteriaceae bacterium]
MLHFLLFLRIAFKNREVYFLKIITLAVALASATLISLFALHEFGYDRAQPDARSVFRLLERNNSEAFSGNRLSVKIPAAVYRQFSSWPKDSIVLARVKIMNGLSIAVGAKLYHERKVHAADTSLLSVFDFKSVNGSVDGFANGALISEQLSLELFGTTASAGRAIKLYALNDTVAYTIAAVFQNFPANTHENFHLFVSFSNKSVQALKFNTTTCGVYGKINQGLITGYESRLNKSLNDPLYAYSFQPLPEIYFGPRVAGEDARHGDAYSILILLCITALILFLAITSFVNLTTLTLPHRSKELAIKKLSGTSQWSLMIMFASESFALVGLAFLLGILILVGLNSFTEPILQINTINLLLSGNLAFVYIALALLLVGGVAPLAMTLKFAKATPTRLLSTDTITFPRFKRIITFLQLGISIFLIVASLVIGRQVNYSLIKEPGRNHYQVVYMPYPAGLTNEGLYELRAGWKKNNPNIDDVIAVSQLPHRVQSKELNSDFYFMTVDRGYREFFNLEVDSGRWFQPNDESPMAVINQAAGLSGSADIIGVVENMDEKFNRPQKPMKYLVASHTKYQFLCVRILEVNIRTTLYVLAHAFDNKSPAQVSFVDNRFEEWLHYQDRLNALSKILAIISGILSCLAIYGLSISLVRDKLKQIAIHKLFGAGTSRITHLLAREFVIQMGIAILVFTPVTFIFLKEFLRNFVYTTPFQWTDPVYPLAYCLGVIVALCGFQALSLNRTDLTNVLKA